MGWYSAFGRPMFFALPPEASHRLAGALLLPGTRRLRREHLHVIKNDNVIGCPLCLVMPPAKTVAPGGQER